MEGRDTPLLSILIPVIPQHEKAFNILLRHLQKQIKDSNEVEVLWSNTLSQLNGGPSSGKKRQILLHQAKGDYVAFIDADDWVHDYYVEEMLRACASGADCFAINGIMTTDGNHETKWLMSKDYQNVDRVEGNKTVYYRHTNHITGVKRRIALGAGFPDKSNAEDKFYSDRLVLRTEFKIEKSMYHYRFSSQNKSYK